MLVSLTGSLRRLLQMPPCAMRASALAYLQFTLRILARSSPCTSKRAPSIPLFPRRTFKKTIAFTTRNLGTITITYTNDFHLNTKTTMTTTSKSKLHFQAPSTWLCALICATVTTTQVVSASNNAEVVPGYGTTWRGKRLRGSSDEETDSDSSIGSRLRKKGKKSPSDVRGVWRSSPSGSRSASPATSSSDGGSRTNSPMPMASPRDAGNARGATCATGDPLLRCALQRRTLKTRNLLPSARLSPQGNTLEVEHSHAGHVQSRVPDVGQDGLFDILHAKQPTGTHRRAGTLYHLLVMDQARINGMLPTKYSIMTQMGALIGDEALVAHEKIASTRSEDPRKKTRLVERQGAADGGGQQAEVAVPVLGREYEAGQAVQCAGAALG